MHLFTVSPSDIDYKKNQSLSLSEYLRAHHNMPQTADSNACYDPQSNATLSEDADAAAEAAGAGAGAATAAAAEGFLIIAFNIEACRSFFRCFWGGSSAA